MMSFSFLATISSTGRRSSLHELVDLLQRAIHVVFAGLTLVFEVLEQCTGVLTVLADAYLGFFARLAHDLGQIAATLLVERRHGQAEQVAVDLRIQAQIALDDRLLHSLHVRLSQTLIRIMRGSGTLTVAIWPMGVGVPQ